MRTNFNGNTDKARVEWTAYFMENGYDEAYEWSTEELDDMINQVVEAMDEIGEYEGLTENMEWYARQ